jgi:steroid delta-isomerase-like uncharacterized protein
MLPEEMEEVLVRYQGAFNAHDVDAALAFCTEDSYYENVPAGFRIEGLEDLAAFWESFFSACPDFEVGLDEQAYGQDTAVAWGSMRGTHLGEFMGVQGTGRRFEVPMVCIVGFRRGFVASDRAYFDLASVCDQLGIPHDAVQGVPG